jgi:energy-coupling factor transporter ATP-binding protein EcfA2
MLSVINPKSNRKISTDSKSFKSLLKDFTYNKERNLLIPKNKDSYVFSIDRYILKSKVPKNYEIKNDKIVLKDILVKAPTGRIIKKNGIAYKKYIKKGYKIINDIFIKPTATITINQPSNDKFTKDILKNTTIAILNIPDLDEQIVYYFKSSKGFFKWYNNASYQFEGLDSNIQLIKSNDKIKFGVSYDGKLNCFIQCVEEHLNNQARIHNLDTIKEFYKNHNDGVFEEDITTIADHYKLFIRIHENKNIYEYGKKEYTKHKTILNLKYSNNHVENITKYNNKFKEEIKESMELLSSNEQKTEIIKYTPNNNFDNLKFNQEFNTISLNFRTEEGVLIIYGNLNDKLKEFTKEELNSIVSIQSDNQLDILGIKLQTKTKETIYKYSSHCGFELKDNEYSIYNKVLNEIMDYFTIQPQTIKSDLEIISQILHNQIFYNKEIIEANKEYKVIDIKNAYDNFGELPTDLLIKINTDKLHSELGFYYITYKCPIKNINVSEWRFTEYIKTLQKHNIKFTIQQAMLSTGKTTLNINELNKLYKTPKTKRYFHIILGKWQVFEFSDTRITTDYELYNKYGGVKYQLNDNQEIYKISIDKNINTNSYYPHIVGAIHEYTNAKLLDTILTYKLKPLRIWVDGIVLEPIGLNRGDDLNEYPSKYPKYFREEIKSYKIEQEPLTYEELCHQEKFENISNDYIELSKSKLSAVLGDAGSGKSTLINRITKIVKNCQVLTPTRMVLRNFETDLKMTYQKFIEPKVKLNTELLLIDECSMISKYILNEIIKKCKCKVILFGDLKQLPVIDGEIIDYDSIETKYLTDNHRQNDIEFINKLLYTFETGKLDYISSKKSVKDCINSNTLILSATNDEINRINKIGYKLSTGDKINSTLKVGMPIIIDDLKLKNKGLYTGDKGYIKSYDGKDILLNILNEDIKIPEKKLCSIKPAYSITYHRIQGQTINDNICLNLNEINYFKEYKNNMLYVGVSRVKKLEQLNLLK